MALNIIEQYNAVSLKADSKKRKVLFWQQGLSQLESTACSTCSAGRKAAAASQSIAEESPSQQSKARTI
jgi:hypothetical protein